MQPKSALHRSAIRSALESETFDLLVIGGGVTGCGIALDAASRGLKTALIEKGDFASGTSSRSTKLIHGGLRYLKQFEIALVREVGLERAKVHHLAPHLVTAEKMLLPILKDGSFSRLLTSFGLLIYDILAGVERADQRRMLNKADTLKAEPLLPEDQVEGGALYAEYRTDDARLTIEIVKTAIDYGARALNYVEASEFIYENDQVAGIQAQDHLHGKSFRIRARQTVSAAGPWVDDLRKLNQSYEGKHLFLTKGVHIVVDHSRLPVEQAVYFDVPDGRMIFAIPRGEVTYIGTTDTPYDGDKNAVRADQADVRYLLDAVNHTFRTVHLVSEDIQSSWAGLRPLIFEEGKSASEISRKDEVFESPSGLISIAGGKLTGYRKMAQKVVDLVARRQTRKLEKCQTDKLVLNGGVFVNAADVEAYKTLLRKHLRDQGFEEKQAAYLVHNYGKQSDRILELSRQFAEYTKPEALILAEADFCIEHELTHRPLDFFMRRTGRMYFWIDSIPKIEGLILRHFQQRFGWTDAQLAAEKQALEAEFRAASHFE